MGVIVLVFTSQCWQIRYLHSVLFHEYFISIARFDNTSRSFLTLWARDWPAVETIAWQPRCKINSMSEISGHDPDFKYIIALTRLMPLNSENLIFPQQRGCEKKQMRSEEREWMKTPAPMQNAIGCVAVLFFSGDPVSFPLFPVPFSFSFEL